MDSQKIKFFIFWIITISLTGLYFLDRYQVKDKINQYKSDITSIETQLFANDIIMGKINNARIASESVMDTIKSYNLSGIQLMDEISRIRSLANQSNILVSKVIVDHFAGGSIGPPTISNQWEKYFHMNFSRCYIQKTN